MPKLPIISAKELVKGLVHLDFEIKSQKGSHIKMINKISNQTLIVPNHNFIKKGTLKNIMRYLNLNNENLIDLLKK
jgi:predicted RNA binding protein YcfA (HicA-like mRNA interferase family)